MNQAMRIRTILMAIGGAATGAGPFIPGVWGDVAKSGGRLLAFAGRLVNAVGDEEAAAILEELAAKPPRNVSKDEIKVAADRALGRLKAEKAAKADGGD